MASTNMTVITKGSFFISCVFLIQVDPKHDVVSSVADILGAISILPATGTLATAGALTAALTTTLLTESTSIISAKGEPTQVFRLFRVSKRSEVLIHLVHHGADLGVIGGCAQAAKQRFATGNGFGIAIPSQCLEISTSRVTSR
jgi:hypothetical protein